MIDKHGLKMYGLKKACSVSEFWYPLAGLETAVYYWPENGRIAAETVTRGTRSLWTDEGYIFVCATTAKLHMQEIADLIAARMAGHPVFRNAGDIWTYLGQDVPTGPFVEG